MGKLRERLPDMPQWTLHDLRRTFRSGLARLGIPPHIAERCVNHHQGGIQAIYDRYQYRDEVTATLLRWANHIEEIVNGSSGAKVIPLRA